MADRLYLLKPGFMDGGGPYFCGECALVEGMLGFFPELRGKVEVTYVDFERPRPAIVRELGEEHQGAPVLVLDKVQEAVPPGVKVHSANGKSFVDEPNQICLYLAARYATPAPHHPI